MQRSRVLRAFEPNQIIQRSALHLALRREYPKATTATLDWHIHTLLEQGHLIRRGWGRYELADQLVGRRAFVPCLPDELVRAGKILRERFPLLTTCMWSTSALQSFTVQQPFVAYWLIETERDAVDVVLDTILAQQRTGTLHKVPALRAVDLQLAQRYHADASIFLLVKALISEAPLQKDITGLNVPTAEKILVDLIADSTVFDLFAEELPTLFAEIGGQFMLNLDRLHRYARRRHQLPNVDEYLNAVHNPQTIRSA
jgi:hypothetical protein